MLTNSDTNNQPIPQPTTKHFYKPVILINALQLTICITLSCIFKSLLSKQKENMETLKKLFPDQHGYIVTNILWYDVSIGFWSVGMVVAIL